MGGCPPWKKLNIDDLCRRVRGGSEEGTRVGAGLFDGTGVAFPGDGDFAPEPAALSFRAILRKGDIDLDNVLEELGERPLDFPPLGGVARYPFLDMVVCPD